MHRHRQREENPSRERVCARLVHFARSLNNPSLLLDAIHTASPDLIDLASPILAPRPLHPHAHAHAQPYPTAFNPHLNPPGPPPGPQGRFSPVGPPNSHIREQDTDYDYDYDYDYEMRVSPRVVNVNSGQGQEFGRNVNANADSSRGVNGNGINPSQGEEVCALWLCQVMYSHVCTVYACASS